MRYKAKPHTTRAFNEALRNSGGQGTVMEFGVRWGRSFVWFAQQLSIRYPKCRLMGFDSWKGLPEETKGIPVHRKHAPGRFREHRIHTEIALNDLGIFTKRVSLIDGWFSDTLTDSLKGKVKTPLLFVHLDCDLYISTIQVLRWIDSLLSSGTILVFDDLKKPENSGWGQRKALNEWMVETKWKCEVHEHKKIYMVT